MLPVGVSSTATGLRSFRTEANQSNSPLVELIGKSALLPDAAMGVTSGVPEGVADGKEPAWLPKISAVRPAPK